ncbi:MAG: DUF6049 family protein [Actinomycetota bacterium]
MRLVRSSRAGAALTLLGLVATAAVTPRAAAFSDPGQLADDAVTVAVQDVAPSTPVYSAKVSPLTITLALTNTTDRTLYTTTINGEREAPLSTGDGLRDLIAHPRQLDPDSTSEMHPMVLDRPLGPHESRAVVYKSSTSNLSDHSSDICLCNPGIYPIDFTVQAAAAADGVPTKVGFAQSFIPSFPDTPQPVRISWLWPLIDRPHRMMSDTSFRDDDLVTSVRPGGRLDRALTVAERVAKKVRLTLVIDPELVDELAVMSQHYTVQADEGRVVAGTGGPAAAAWLLRLRATLHDHDVSRTPYADPDIAALTARGLPWGIGAFDLAQQQRVSAILGPSMTADIAWPAGEAIGSQGLQELVRAGAAAVILNDTTLPGGANQSPRLDALAPLPGVAGAVAAVTDRTLQAALNPLLAIGGSGRGRLPQLVAQLAMRAVEAPQRAHYVVLAPARQVDPDPVAAVRTMLDTTTARWAAPLSIRQAMTRVAPVDHGSLVAPPASPLPHVALEAAAQAAEFENSFRSALSAPDAALLFAGLSAAIQRTASAAWRQDPLRSAGYASALDRKIAGWRNSVQIQRPSNGSYTLASTSAPLFVTVINKLPVPVKVRVSLTTVNGVVGFRADDVGPQEVPAGQKAPLRIPVHVQRAGRFEIAADVTTPAGDKLGATVMLGINSTALGRIGVIITTGAAGVLVLALLMRLYRRWRFRSAQRTVA